jgi:hypothetical protein
MLVRARSEDAATEVLLGGSSASGPALRVSLNRKLLLRALKLGFRTLSFAKTNPWSPATASAFLSLCSWVRIWPWGLPPTRSA